MQLCLSNQQADKTKSKASALHRARCSRQGARIQVVVLKRLLYDITLYWLYSTNVQGIGLAQLLNLHSLHNGNKTTVAVQLHYT